MNPLTLFALVLQASLFSTGGMGNLPSIHSDLIRRGWASEQQFIEALAVGQVAPGPNGLWVVSLGYFVDGLRGGLLALLAITLPPFGVLLLARSYQRHKDHPAVEGFVRGLSLAVVGLFAVVMVRLLREGGFSLRSGVVIALTVALALTRRVPVVVILFVAALLGLVWL